MKRTRIFIIGWLTCFFGLLGIGGGYEWWTLKNPIPNDTISHVMTPLIEQYPWIPVVFVVFMVGLWPAFWATCALHWWSERKDKDGKYIFWWKKAKVVEEKKDTQSK